MDSSSILARLLVKKFHISGILAERKRRLMGIAREAIRNATRSLKRDGHKVSFLKDGLLVRDEGLLLAYLSEEADSLLIMGLKARYSPSELFIICWNAKESLIESAMNGELHLAMLSRGQVIHWETDFSRTILKFLRDNGLNLCGFRSLLRSEDPLEEETALLSELLTLREMYNRMILGSIDERILLLLNDLEEMVKRGADESEMNELLIAILEAYPVDVDENASGKAGKPDIVAYSPLWMLFELKNERAIKGHVDQIRSYVDHFKGSASSPLGIPWKGILVAPSASPDVYAYALSRDVKVATWESLIGFLRFAFTKAVPIELLRIATEYEDVERGISELTDVWLKKFSRRVTILRALQDAGEITREYLASELASSGISDMGELEFVLRELSGPILEFIREEEGLLVVREGNPFPRIYRAISYLRRELYGE